MFLDTNVLVSAFATRGLCADVLRYVLAEHELIVGEVVLRELRKVLLRRVKLPRKVASEVEDFLRDREVVAKPHKPSSIPIRDASDRWILALAVEGKSDVLVTGDRDLLDVKARSPLPIVDPRGFWIAARKWKR